MLLSLSIRDVLLIEKADLEFGPGLNVLTGETGAGKSILLDCLGLVLGWRGRADIVRQGASEGEVTAVFELSDDHPAQAVLEEAGLPRDEQLILRRTTSADGRKRGFVNDRRVSGEVMRALSDTLVELHGQHDDRGLLDPRGHRALLDAYGALGAQKDKVRSAWRTLAEARKALDAAETALASAARDADYLRHAAKELSELDPQPGEEAFLDAERRRMQMAAKIGEDITRAAQAMGPDGAEGRLGDAMRWLETVADRADGALDAPLGALGRAVSELSEAIAATEGVLDDMSFDAHALERVEERLFAIRGLARKHNVLPDELSDLTADFVSRVAQFEGGDAEIADLRKSVEAAEAAYGKVADALGKARRKAGRALDKAMAGELPPLKLDQAVFETEIAQADTDGPEGRDLVTFKVATNPGAPSGPINRIASGGELSRFLLALKVCLTGRAEGLTMIFDEIDRGVGGATADAVGRRLAQVAEAGQVLVVTHAPQIAALGQHHFLVSKTSSKASAQTRVAALGEDDRLSEIARMLAGDTITDEARSAARALLAG